MIDISKETILTLPEAANRLPSSSPRSKNSRLDALPLDGFRLSRRETCTFEHVRHSGDLSRSHAKVLRAPHANRRDSVHQSDCDANGNVRARPLPRNSNAAGADSRGHAAESPVGGMAIPKKRGAARNERWKLHDPRAIRLRSDERTASDVIKQFSIRTLWRNLGKNAYLKVPGSVPQSAGLRTSKCRGPYPKVPDSVPQVPGPYPKVPGSIAFGVRESPYPKVPGVRVGEGGRTPKCQAAFLL